MKLCLSANSGGHLNQLLQLKNIYKKYDYFFLTDKNSFSEELSKREKVYYVEKFIFKEIISKFQIIKPLINISKSLIIYIKERPDIIITTGAGTSFGIWLWGKIFKSKVIFIESIARTNKPSTFGEKIGSKSDIIFVQWRNMLRYYKNAIFGGLIFNFQNIEPNLKKITKIFITTGTYKLQFNRLLNEIDILIEKKQINCNIVAQIGASDYKPKHYKYFDFCGQEKLHELIDQSDLIICQGGSGSIMDSLLRGKRVISIPRLPEYNEFFDNHQIQLINELEKMGLILGVYDIKNLGESIKKADSFIPDFKKMDQSNYSDYFEKYLKTKIWE